MIADRIKYEGSPECKGPEDFLKGDFASIFPPDMDLELIASNYEMQAETRPEEQDDLAGMISSFDPEGNPFVMMEDYMCMQE